MISGYIGNSKHFLLEASVPRKCMGKYKFNKIMLKNKLINMIFRGQTFFHIVSISFN